MVDKTGTLTEGRPSVTQVVALDDFDRDELLRLAAGVERASEHPLAQAVVHAAEAHAAEAQGMSIPSVSDFDSPVGKGVVGVVEGHRVLLGSATFLLAHDLDTAALTDRADELRADGATAIFIGVDDRVAGIFAIADPVKETTPAALEALRAEGIEVVMLTGDNRVTATAVARMLHIDRVEAEVLPDHKSDIVTRLRAEGRVVAMAGDGVTLLRGDLTGMVNARRLSQATMSNVRQNLVFASIYNVAGIPVAAGVLYPAFGLLLSPIIAAAAAMALSSVSVIANALRLRTARV